MNTLQLRAPPLLRVESSNHNHYGIIVGTSEWVRYEDEGDIVSYVYPRILPEDSYWSTHAVLTTPVVVYKSELTIDEASTQTGNGHIGKIMTKEFWDRFPEHGNIIISIHAARRILERFGKINSQIMRAIIRAKKRASGQQQGRDSTYGAVAIVEEKSNGKWLVVSIWQNK